MPENPKQHLNDLIESGVLNLEDLNVNQSGYLADRQKRILYLNYIFWVVLVILDILALMFFIYLSLFIQKAFLLSLIEVIIFAYVIYMCMKNAQPYWKDIKDDKPKSVSGKLHKHFSELRYGRGGRWGVCSVTINNKTFSIPHSAYEYIIQDGTYRIYFTAQSRKVVNIEPL